MENIDSLSVCCGTLPEVPLCLPWAMLVPRAIVSERGEQLEQLYFVEEILDKRKGRRGRGFKHRYVVKWTGYIATSIPCGQLLETLPTLWLWLSWGLN